MEQISIVISVKILFGTITTTTMVLASFKAHNILIYKVYKCQ